MMTAGAAPVAASSLVELTALLGVIKDPKLYAERLEDIQHRMDELAAKGVEHDRKLVAVNAALGKLEAKEKDLAKREELLAAEKLKVEDAAHAVADDRGRIEGERAAAKVVAQELARTAADLDAQRGELDAERLASGKVKAKVDKAWAEVDGLLREATLQLEALNGAATALSSQGVAVAALAGVAARHHKALGGPRG